MTAVFLGAPAAAQDADLAALEGRWVGEYRLNGKATFVILLVSRDGGKLTATYNRPAIDAEEYREARGFAATGDGIGFAMGGDGPSPFVASNPALQAQVSLPGGLGSVKLGTRRGSLTLVHLPTLEKDYLESLAGDYRLPDGSLLVIERENRYLCFLEQRTGRTGRLMPHSATEFWSGPAMDIWYPAEWRFQFMLIPSGETKLKVSRPGGTQFTARRVALYRRQDVTFTNGTVTLAGTLRLPVKRDPAPAVVMLHGSNYQTRGGQYGGIGFMADAFARRGFVVLNYDKRGTGKSGGERDDNSELLSGDAAAAVALLRSRSEVDAARVGLWGVSQGGMLQPAVAAKVKDLAFFVNISGAAGNGNDQEIQRTELKLKADGFSQADVKAAVHLQQLKFHYACHRDNWEQYIAAVDAARSKPWFLDPYIGPPDDKQSTAWDFWGCGGEGAKGFERLKAPVLYVWAEHEANSRADLNVKLLREAAQASGNRHLTIHEFKGAEHSMFRAANGGEKEALRFKEYVPGYFDYVGAWAARAAGPGARSHREGGR